MTRNVATKTNFMSKKVLAMLTFIIFQDEMTSQAFRPQKHCYETFNSFVRHSPE